MIATDNRQGLARYGRSSFRDGVEINNRGAVTGFLHKFANEFDGFELRVARIKHRWMGEQVEHGAGFAFSQGDPARGISVIARKSITARPGLITGFTETV